MSPLEYQLAMALLKKAGEAGKRAWASWVKRVRYTVASAEERKDLRAAQRLEWELKSKHATAKANWSSGTPFWRSVVLRSAGVAKEDLEAIRQLSWHELDPGLKDRLANVEQKP